MMNHTDGMMNHTDGWMSGWTGGGMWNWAVIGVAVAVLLVVVIIKLFKKYSCDHDPPGSTRLTIQDPHDGYDNEK